MSEEKEEEEMTLGRAAAAIVDANAASVAYWPLAAATTPAPLYAGRRDDADGGMGTAWRCTGSPGTDATSDIASATGVPSGRPT
jgi:hypothetical protein